MEGVSNYLKNVVVHKSATSGVGMAGSPFQARGGLLDIFSKPVARNEQERSLRLQDYWDMMNRYGYAVVHRLVSDIGVDVDVEFKVDYPHRIPSAFVCFLTKLGFEVWRYLYFVPRFKVLEDSDGKNVIKEDKVWAGSLHPRYVYAHDVEYASKKVEQLKLIVEQLQGRLFAFRADDYHFDKETGRLEKRWEGVKLLQVRSVYVSRFLFTLPAEVSDFLYFLFILNREEYEKFVKDLKNALICTLYRLVWYQLKRDGVDVGDFSCRKMRDRFLVSAVVNLHLTHSFHISSVDYELLISDEDKYCEKRCGREVDVFESHHHFHVLLPNFIYDKKLGIFIRIDFFYNNEIVRHYWKSAVLRVVKRYDKYLYDSILGSEFVAGTDKAWKLDSDKAFEEVFHFIKYSHRPAISDILLYFEFNNNRETVERILEKYDVDWLRYLVNYSNRTFVYGVFANLGAYFDLSSVDNEVDVVEVQDGDGMVEVDRDLSHLEVFEKYLSKKDAVVVEDKVGKMSRRWLYTRTRRPPN